MPSQNLPATPDARLPKIPLSDISFEHLAPDHDLLPFSCRQQEQRSPDRRRAENQDAHVAVTYPALHDGKCVGYFSVLNDSIIKKDIDPEDDKDWYAHSTIRG